MNGGGECWFSIYFSYCFFFLFLFLNIKFMYSNIYQWKVVLYFQHNAYVVFFSMHVLHFVWFNNSLLVPWVLWLLKVHIPSLFHKGVFLWIFYVKKGGEVYLHNSLFIAFLVCYIECEYRLHYIMVVWLAYK